MMRIETQSEQDIVRTATLTQVKYLSERSYGFLFYENGPTDEWGPMGYLKSIEPSDKHPGEFKLVFASPEERNNPEGDRVWVLGPDDYIYLSGW